MHKIILLTGGPGSGKSTIAHLLAQHFSKSLHLQVDHLRGMMVNGISLPGKGWTTKRPDNSDGRAILPFIWRNCIPIKALML